MSRSGIDLKRRFTLPTRRYDALAAGELDLDDPRGLSDDGDVDLGAGDDTRTYHRFSRRDIDAGDEVRARIVLDTGGGPARVVAPIVAGLLALALIAIG